MIDRQQEALYAMALTRISYFNLTSLLQLYDKLGSATEIMAHRNDIRDVVPDAAPRLVESLRHTDEAMARAEGEMAYDERYGIEPLAISDPRYPQRLRECSDAPLVLFYRGTADLNQQRIVCIVGTRHCTAYGQDLVRRFIEDLRTQCPQVLIVSGLAYGVDIHAHRNALQQGFETVGVLAHGLDQLYPPRHASTANEMTHQGGLLTEFFTLTRAEKMNFVRRNRIVAGMSDACILVESAARGGGLITARLARDYNREVFAFPGNVGAPYSEGCNNLIRDNGAVLLTSAEHFVTTMGWQDDAALRHARQTGIERELFPDLSDEEKLVVGALSQSNDQQLNMLAVRTNLPIARLTALLFEMELKGVVKPYAGGTYHLLM